MWAIARMMGATFALVACVQNAGLSQEFRVYTSIHDVSTSPDRDTHDPDASQIVSRSLTLFHAGKAYDYIDTVGELTVFEPTLRRFTLLNGSRMLVTTVAFDQLAELQKMAERETRKYVQGLHKSASPPQKSLIGALESQIDPRFDEQFDEETHRLTLASKPLRYDVRCAAAAVPEAVETYLGYADWTARLNYVLHPHVLFPAPRLKLNEALRRHQLMPTEVELRAKFERPLHLRAEHRIHWDLSPKDRSYIHHWESLLRDKKVRHVSFREYQETLLAGGSK